MTNSVETGEIHFFYRTKLDVEQPSGVDDLQRVYLALVPDDRDQARLFVIGRKKLPEIISGESDPNERNWMLLSLVGTPKDIGEVLHPEKYDTKTKGEQVTAEAIPVGSGRYAIVPHDDSSQLVYRLGRPKTPGNAQEALLIEQEGRYVIAVRNPSVDVSGFPDASPDYPDDLAGKFADERWIDISDPRLLDYEDAQLVLIGASEDSEPLDVDLDGNADPFDTFSLDAEKWPKAALEEGSFAAPKREVTPFKPDSDRGKGGRRGGPKAAKTDSASGVASALKGVSYPSDRSDLVSQAKDNDAPEEVVNLIESIPDQKFETMADVMEAVGKVR